MPVDCQRYLATSASGETITHGGTRMYDISDPQSEADSVGQPLIHQWARQCTTGEAVYIDDIRPAQGMIHWDSLLFF